jgi:exopolysaccharide biosynthesis WecB/TagA/CpsF family protein
MDLPAATAAVATRDAGAPFAYVATINAQILLLAEDHASGLREAHGAAWLRLNDSGILARLHRWALGQAVPVAAGSDLCLALLSRVIAPTDRITVIGGGPLLAGALAARFGLRHIAQHEPPMGYMAQEAARAVAIAFIEEHPARFTFVATGAPRSELLLAAVAARRRARGTGLAIGSGLLFAAGLTPRAPAWMRRSGLEWLYRAMTEPRRLGPRYAADALPLLRLAWRARRKRL